MRFKMAETMRCGYPYEVAQDKSCQEYIDSAKEQLPQEGCLFTHGCNPQYERYEEYPPSLLEEGPSSPNDSEIAK